MSITSSASTHSKRKRVSTQELLSCSPRTHSWSMPLEALKETFSCCKLSEPFLRTSQFASKVDFKVHKEQELTVLTSTHSSSLNLIWLKSKQRSQRSQKLFKFTAKLALRPLTSWITRTHSARTKWLLLSQAQSQMSCSQRLK